MRHLQTRLFSMDFLCFISSDGLSFSSQALSKTLTVDELHYMKEQFALLEPNKNGAISLENIKSVGFMQNVFSYFEQDFGLHSCS